MTYATTIRARSLLGLSKNAWHVVSSMMMPCSMNREGLR
jgi:hypothetical protein